MTTAATEEAPATAASSSLTVFNFNDKGFCTNPEIINVPTPEGSRITCSLYLAEKDGGWFWGYAYAGPKLKLVKHAVDALVSPSQSKRELALRDAIQHAIDYLPESPDGVCETLTDALEDFGEALTFDETAKPKEEPDLLIGKQAFEAEKQGLSKPDIAKALNISLPAVHNALKHYRAAVAGGVTLEEKSAPAETLPGIDPVAPGIAPLIEAPSAATGQPPPAGVVVPRTYRTSFAEVPLWAVQRNPENHRKHFDAGKLAELAESIRLEGLHQPIAVRRLLPGETPEAELTLGQDVAPGYELICGERRWRASQLAGVPVISAKIYEDLPRVACHAIALIENLQREGINCMEEAEGYAALMRAENLTQEQCAERIGRARSSIANCLRLLKLPAAIREYLRDGVLSLAHGIALARFADWPKHLAVIVEETIRDEAPSSSIEKGVPYSYSLTQKAGLAVRIYRHGEFKITDKLKKHPAYFQDDDGDFICFEPDHWKEELRVREEAKKAKEEKERLAREAEIAKASKKGKKQLALADLNREDYHEFKGAHTALNDLVPDDKKAIAKDYDGAKSTIVTDVQLAERLKGAMQRAIKKNRREACVSLEQKALKKITALKKVGPREFAWLVYLITEIEGRRVNLNLDVDARAAAGVKLPKGVGYNPAEEDDYDEDEMKTGQRVAVLARLVKCDQVALVKTLMAERLPTALTDVIEFGPDSEGAQILRWWLDTDTLWLLEETPEGLSELIDLVKKSPTVAKALAGDASEEDDE